jgi:hypothetical protein
MWRSIFPWLATLLIGLACWLPAARAQNNPLFERGTPAPEAAPAERPAALAWGVAGLFTLAILVIACKPSRKTQT